MWNLRSVSLENVVVLKFKPKYHLDLIKVSKHSY